MHNFQYCPNTFNIYPIIGIMDKIFTHLDKIIWRILYFALSLTRKVPRYFIVFYLMFHRKPNWKLKLNLRFLKTFSMLLPLSK